MSAKVRVLMLSAAALVFLFLAGAVIVYLRSERFQEQMRTLIVTRIEQATGLRVGLERLSLDAIRGTFVVSRLSLRTRRETGNRIEFSVDEVTGVFRLTTLWRPRVELAELTIIRPRFAIRQEPGGGTWSLAPIMKRSIDVAARKAAIRDGWVELNNRRIPLNLTVDALNCSIRYRPSPQSYNLQVEYKNSPLQWAGRSLSMI